MPTSTASPARKGRPSRRRPESVFFVSLPKSGTVYTWYTLEAMTGLRMPQFHLMRGWPEYTKGLDFACPELYACGDYNTQLLVPTRMRRFLRGYIFGAHMQASYHNMRVLKDCGIRRITVLLRDPRDAFISWVHHLRALGPTARDYHSKIYHIPRAYYGWPAEEQLNWQLRAFFPVIVNWVEGWLDYCASEDREVDVLLVFYDELKRDPIRYVRRIAQFHGLENVDYAKAIAPREGELHFRRGEHEQWRDEFTAEQCRLTDALMGERLLDGFVRAARRHEAFRRAEAALEAGDAEAALCEGLNVIAAFPSQRVAYVPFLRALERTGTDSAPVRAAIEQQLGEGLIEMAFRYPQDLIDMCGAAVPAHTLN